MHTDIGEYVVGAYLKLKKGCNVVDYNACVPGGGVTGLAEFDVVGYDFVGDRVFLCEVATHIRGLNYGSYEKSLTKIREKFQRQQEYARSHLGRFQSVKYQFWSPNVPVGALTRELGQIQGLELVINDEYKAKVDELIAQAETNKHDTGNPFFRALQIMAAMR